MLLEVGVPITLDDHIPFDIMGSECVGAVVAVDEGVGGEGQSSNTPPSPTDSLFQPPFKVGDIVIPNTVNLSSYQSELPPLPANNFTTISDFVTAKQLHQQLFPPTMGSSDTHLNTFLEEVELVPDYESVIADALKIQVNPSTAYRMLVDYFPPSSFNGEENSVILVLLIAASQLAKSIYGGGIKVCSVIRRGDKTEERIEEEVKYLVVECCVDFVLFEEDLKAARSPRHITNFLAEKLECKQTEVRVPLALDSVGGEIGTMMINSLTDNGVHVTYGGLSLKPVSVRAGGLIFKDVSLRGFWLTRWMMDKKNVDERIEEDKERLDEHGNEIHQLESKEKPISNRTTMLRHLWSLKCEGKLNLPELEVFGMDQVEDAVRRVGSGVEVAFDCREMD